eukprot:GHVS01082014.1.p2 GENE.GHVS01082014.1~~GHVS01082014.1.p2  ORF type:complete len:130 (-),score=3.27 GHVS01082014.1:454-843(-)
MRRCRCVCVTSGLCIAGSCSGICISEVVGGLCVVSGVRCGGDVCIKRIVGGVRVTSGVRIGRTGVEGIVIVKQQREVTSNGIATDEDGIVTSIHIFSGDEVGARCDDTSDVVTRILLNWKALELPLQYF